MVDFNTGALIVTGIYLVVAVVGHIVSFFMYLDEGDEWPTRDRIYLGLALTFWPISGVAMAIILLIEKRGGILVRVTTVRRRVTGKYWTLRARIAKEEDGFTWDR